MKLCPSITVLPYIHAKLAFAQQVRDVCLTDRFDCIAVDLPAVFEEKLFDAVHDMPFISAVIACGWSADPVYYIPVDPCDAAIEAIRQSRQNHVACFCIGSPVLVTPPPLPPLPDEYAVTQLGFDAYMSLCLRTTAAGNQATPHQSDNDVSARFIASRLHGLKAEYKNILALVHLRSITGVTACFGEEKTCNFSFAPAPDYSMSRDFINPDHLYFALGELPYVTGKYERERYEPFSGRIDVKETIKTLFIETRDEYKDDRADVIAMSPSRVQCGLTFLRNLTIGEDRFIPTMFDIVTAAKGVGGNSYALNILNSARYYPYLPFELDCPLLSVGIDRIVLPGETASRPAVNLFRDCELFWRTISLTPEPSKKARQNYRFSWNPHAACSHVPEDRMIERFNSHVRNRAAAVVCEDRCISEKFMASAKDGIDIRETMRHWFTSDIYVKEIPPFRGKVDTVVIIFDDRHDDRYPYRVTWYAEHDEESTLTFYATDPFDDMIGPGVARSYYGGLSLLFPPRLVPNIFETAGAEDLRSCSEFLAWGALLYSQEKIIPYVSAKKPGVRLRRMAQKAGKQFVWIPLETFSMETIKRLRRFHVLNGKTVRAWAGRFIGE